MLFLQRDFHLYLVNVFDTEKACQVRLCWALDLMAWSTCNVELMTSEHILHQLSIDANGSRAA